MIQTPLDGLIDKISFIENNIDSLVIEACRQLEQDFLTLQRKQLFDGEKGADGSQIRPEYAESTIVRKRDLGLPADRVTWFETGELYSNIVIEYGDDEFVIGIDDFKLPFLVDRYGDDVIGITPKNLEVISPEVQEELLRIIKKIL